MIPALPKVVNGCQRMPALSQALRAEAAKTDKRIKLQRIPQLSGLGGAPQEESSSMCCFSAFLAKHLAICDTCIPFGPRVPTGRDGLRRSLSRRSRCFASADERPAIIEAGLFGEAASCAVHNTSRPASESWWLCVFVVKWCALKACVNE
jgi:hypothetical protein